MTEVNGVLQSQAPGPELGGDAKASGNSLWMMKQYGGARAGGRELGDRAGGSSWRGMELACRAVSGGGRGAGAGKPGGRGHSKGARAGGRGSELEAVGGAELGGKLDQGWTA